MKKADRDTLTDSGEWAAFVVRGLPVTQGSKIASVNRHTGKAVMREVNGSALDHWRSAIATEARTSARERLLLEPLTGAVRVQLHFMLPRPASEPKTRRTWPVRARSGDVDKLARACLDAITHVLIADDSQVVDLHVTKDWATDGLVGVLIKLDEVR
jgi:crossover junction endodeoxyribonuclease RusA